MIVYRHIRLDINKVFYIGIGKDINRAYSKKRSKKWFDVIKNTEYKVDILFEDLTIDEAFNKEIELIKLYGREDLNEGFLVNLTNGGAGINNFKHKESTKKILSNKAKEQGLGGPIWLGKKHKESTINKLKNKIITDETKDKLKLSWEIRKSKGWYSKLKGQKRDSSIGQKITLSKQKIKSDVILEIKRLLDEGFSVNNIVKIIGYSRNTIYRIKNNKTYKNIFNENE
jgi:hypothetical protein